MRRIRLLIDVPVGRRHGLTKGCELDVVCDECGGELMRRSDDSEEVVRERLSKYHHHEKDLLDFYRDTGQTIIELDCDRPLASIFADFEKTVGARKP